jgi:hypothetical protein
LKHLTAALHGSRAAVFVWRLHREPSRDDAYKETPERNDFSNIIGRKKVIRGASIHPPMSHGNFELTAAHR